MSYYINQYNRENELIIETDGVSIICVAYMNHKFFLNHNGWSVECKENIMK